MENLCIHLYAVNVKRYWKFQPGENMYVLKIANDKVMAILYDGL